MTRVIFQLEAFPVFSFTKTIKSKQLLTVRVRCCKDIIWYDIFVCVCVCYEWEVNVHSVNIEVRGQGWADIVLCFSLPYFFVSLHLGLTDAARLGD